MIAPARTMIAFALAAMPIGAPTRAVQMSPADLPSVSMQVQAGYAFTGGGNYRVTGPVLNRAADAWAPIHITLRNAGVGEVDGRLDISDNTGQPPGNFPPNQADYILDVKLPPGSRKMVEMYVRGADLASPLAVSFTSGHAVVASSSIDAAAQTPGTLSVGVLSDDTATRTALRPLKLGDAGLSVTQFDDAAPLDTQPQALQNFDLIVLANYASETLSSAQVAALRSWVQGGGVLLEAGGPDAQKTLGGLAPDLLAVTWRPSASSVELAPTLPELARLAGDATGATGPAELSVAAARPGATVLAGHGGIPLAVDLALGRGYVVYSALEPALAPFAAWQPGAQGDYWWHVLGRALAGPLDTLIQANALSSAGSGPPVGAANIGADLANLPSRSLPSLQIYALLIVLYILVLGPGNFLVLRSLRRLELSWLTIPAMAVTFGAASFGLAYARNGGDVLANVDTVVYLDAGVPSKLADSYVGVFAPYQADYYTVSTPGPALAWSLSSDNGQSILPGGSRPMLVDEGPRFSARLYGLQMWSMRTLAVRQQIDLPGRIEGRLALRGSLVSGAVTNTTGLTLYDCVIAAANGNSRPIPILGPHQTASVAPFALNGLNGGSLAPGGAALPANLYVAVSQTASGLDPSRYDSILSALFPAGTPASAAAPLVLIGWSTQPVSPLAVNGAVPRRSDLVLFVAPLRLSTDPGPISLAPTALPVSVIGTTAAPGLNSGGAITLNPNDYLDLQLALPAARRRIRVETLSVQINATPGATLGPGNAALWNWVTRRWQSIDLSTGSWSSSHAAGFASPDGRVWLRLTATQSSLSFSNVSQSVGIGATARVIS